jgi:hypothetical protein
MNDKPNTEILWEVFYIECEQGVLGVMHQSHLVIGIPLKDASIYGQRKVFYQGGHIIKRCSRLRKGVH